MKHLETKKCIQKIREYFDKEKQTKQKIVLKFMKRNKILILCSPR